MKLTGTNGALIHSYLDMRRIIGILAIALPVVLIAGGLLGGGTAVQGSLSSYYYTNMRDFFVGMLFTVALFLISYKGYEAVDDVVTNLSGLFALGIVAFPTSMFSGHIVRVGVFLVPDNISQYVHLAFSVLFLLSLAFNSMFLFTRHGGAPSREKRIRNRIYTVSGVIMVICIAGMVTYIAFFSHTRLASARPVLVFESIALASFGVSWLIKGNALFRDEELSALR